MGTGTAPGRLEAEAELQEAVVDSPGKENHQRTPVCFPASLLAGAQQHTHPTRDESCVGHWPIFLRMGKSRPVRQRFAPRHRASEDQGWGSCSPAEGSPPASLPCPEHSQQHIRVRRSGRREEDAKVNGTFRFRSEEDSRN